ncbi:rho GTPase-activating protein 1-like [Asparagus officinalis]|nr:rho GTPase-activating protein 1-like [Asparagus officinalis]
MAAVLQSQRTLLSPVDEGSKGGREEEELSLIALLITLLRKSLVGCRLGGEEISRSMEIGWPTDVRHVAHVTFDRFHGFLGLPVEFEPEVPRRAPSASVSVFGVSTESMQCSFDCRGNSVPTILLLMQQRLYEQGGLQAEGIFRINADNSQEEYVRDQLNHGIVPDGIDVHCLAGLIKAWFRELPTGVLDSLNPERVMQCQSEEECAQLVKLLPPTQYALLDWAINLMADIVQEEHHNKMNARNVAMVFAPNMTQMADPLTALMYAVQVMNFLKMLILRTLKSREEPILEAPSACQSSPSDENGHHSPKFHVEDSNEETVEQTFVHEEPLLVDDTSTKDHATDTSQISPETDLSIRRGKKSKLRNKNSKKGSRRFNVQSIRLAASEEKPKGISIVKPISSRAERVEAWR